MSDNSLEKVRFRESVLQAQAEMFQMIENGQMKDVTSELTLTHYFTPIDEKYGCCTYARQCFLPKHSWTFGKIHRHQHLNFILKGKVIVVTEFGRKHFEAPCTFISEVGLKRAVFAVEDTLWTTVHLTQFNSEADLDKIEEEVIAPNYETLGLIASIDKFLEKHK